MAKEKRTKPCSNCKKSKVKCIYTDKLPCERCIKIGQISNCQFIPKLPSLKLPSIPPETHSEISFPPLNPISLNGMVHQPQYTSSTAVHHPAESYLVPAPSQPLISHTSSNMWQTQIENRMNSFDHKINDLMEMLKANQQFVMEMQQQQQQQQQRIPQHTYQSIPLPHFQRTVSPSALPQSRYSTEEPEIPKQNTIPNHDDTPEPSRKRSKLNHTSPSDFRDGCLSKQEAHELFIFFDTNISQQLFGFEISKFTVDSLWDSCPVLVCAISTIASIHHPQLSSKSARLQTYLHELCSQLLFQGKPANETDGLNTIVALILCSFWMSDAQMFTGLALQLAKEYGLNNPNSDNKDRLKIWYLLYVLDGQQSLTFNRQPLVNSRDYSLVHSRELLLNDTTKKVHGASKQKIKDKPRDQELVGFVYKQKLTDMRLVSQVEYNQALNEAFKGNAWDLLAPSSFGIPSKSNLELDKWMVSWTVLLAPGNYGAVWSTKSTLIYYNFAKMHINSSAVRQLQIDPNDYTGPFPKWDSSCATPKRLEEVTREYADSDSDSDSDSSSQEDEFISNKELLSPDEAVINANIAVNAAQTVLNLVINDKDIVDNLKYIPVHIHIMLYYAALLLINPPLQSNNKSVEYNPESYYRKLLDNLRTINILKKRIYSNLPIDAKFGSRLILSLEDIETDKLNKVKQFVDTLDNGEVKDDFIRLINTLVESSDNIEILAESTGSSAGSTPRHEKISAWPGSNHGHP